MPAEGGAIVTLPVVKPVPSADVIRAAMHCVAFAVPLHLRAKRGECGL